MARLSRTQRLGWGAFGIALALHLVALSTIVLRVEEKRRGEHTPLPRIFRLFNDGAHRVGPGADFFALYHAAVMLERDGRIYSGGADGVTPPYYVYRYLPAFAQTVGRLARLVSPWTAYLAWIALLEALLVGCMLLTRELFGRGPLVPWLWALWLAYTPFWLELIMGQFSFAAGGLVFLAGGLAFMGKGKRALLPWIAAVSIKIYPLVLLPLWWRRGLFVLSSLLVALVALGNVPGFLHLPDTWPTFVGMNLAPTSVAPANAGNYGFAFFEQLILLKAFRLRGEYWPLVQRAGTLVALGAALALAARRRGLPLLSGIAALMLAHQVTYKDVWEHHYSMVLPMGLFLLRDNLEHRRFTCLIGAALVALALPTPFVLWDRPGGDPAGAWNLAQQLAVPGAKALPALFLFGTALWTLQRAPAVATERGKTSFDAAQAPG
ncbi:MAG TPA: glycosyltransferase 87 family protein [Vulgatibacter sp.]